MPRSLADGRFVDADRQVDLIGEDALGARRLQGIALGIEVLVAGGDAGLADNHVKIGTKNGENRNGFLRGGLLTGRISVRAVGVTAATVLGKSFQTQWQEVLGTSPPDCSNWIQVFGSTGTVGCEVCRCAAITFSAQHKSP